MTKQNRQKLNAKILFNQSFICVLFLVLHVGTGLTQKQLDEKVISQLMEHKLLLDEKETERGTKKEQALKVEVKVEKVSTVVLAWLCCISMFIDCSGHGNSNDYIALMSDFG